MAGQLTQNLEGGKQQITEKTEITIFPISLRKWVARQGPAHLQGVPCWFKVNNFAVPDIFFKLLSIRSTSQQL